MASVNLIQAAAIPGLKGCFVQARVDMVQSGGECLLFGPEHQSLDSLGVSALESLISVDDKGIALVPIQNCQGSYIRLKKGTCLGMIRPIRLWTPEVLQPEGTDSGIPGTEPSSTCSQVTGYEDKDQRALKLLEALGLPEGKLSSPQVAELKALLQEYSDVFALDDSELGCTDIVCHSINTGDHCPIWQQPYRTPIARRDAIKRLVNQMQQQGIVRPSRNPWASPVVLVPKRMAVYVFAWTTVN